MDGIQWGDVLLDLLRRLHTGAVFGTAGRIALAVIGLAIVVLNGTSLYTWLTRTTRRAHKAGLAREPAGSTATVTSN